ncbi:MAG: AarF/ABC1/UbiB kinase family protein, partial [Flavobacteriaceae bacterium]|nr:AarF/ABC1/UbiB kinase family protein [Flavobacteriaceae bacterium]
PKLLNKKFYELGLLRKDDTKKEIEFFTSIFKEMFLFFTAPFNQVTFDFSDENFIQRTAAISEKYMKNSELKSMNGNRGSKHLIYLHRSILGLYNLMFILKASHIEIRNFE